MSLFHKIAFLLALALLVLAAWVQVRFAIGGDKGWLLLAAGRWLSGEKLYVDIIEISPPLILWIYSLAAWLSLHCAFLADYAALGLMGILATMVATGLSLRVITSHPVFADDAAKRVEFGLLVTAVLFFFVSPVYFFDREHIMLCFTFPYALRFMPTLARVQYPLFLRVIIGLFAAVGFCIKPHAALAFVALQALYLVRDRSTLVLLSIENCVIYLFAAVYFALLLCFYPDYFSVVLPMAWAAYSDFNLKANAHYYLPWAAAGAVIPLLDFRARYATPYRRDIYYFMGLALIALGYACINNGWGYTYLPLLSMITFLTGWLAWEYAWLKAQQVVRRLPGAQVSIGLRLSLFCLLVNVLYGCLALYGELAMPGCGGYAGCDDNKPYVDAIREKSIHSFGVVSGEFTRWPLISRESGARWVTRFNHLWMVPALMKAQEGGHMKEKLWILNDAGNSVADDFTRHRPEAVFVDNSDEFFTYPHHVDIPALLSKAPAFREAWSHYRLDGSIDHCKSKLQDSSEKVGCRYDIYRRVEQPVRVGP